MTSKSSRMTGILLSLLMAAAMVAALLLTRQAKADEMAPASERGGTISSVISKLVAVPAPAEIPPAEESQSTSGTPAEQTGEPAPPPDIRVSPEGRVEMHVRELDLGTVLQMLSMQSKRNIVATPSVTGTVTANLYRVTFEEALTAVLDGNNCKWLERGTFIYVYTNEEFKALEEAARPLTSRLFKLYYVRAADIQTLVQPLLGEQGKISVTPPAEVGVATSADNAGGDALAAADCLLVTERPERLAKIADLIAELDVRPVQVLVEATILRAQLNEDNALGIDFNFVGGVDFKALNSTSPGVTDLTTGNVPLNRLNDTNMTTRTDFNAGVPEGGFTFGLVKGSLAVFIRALEQITDTVVMANPKILVLNKQHGEVIVGRRDGYLTTTVTETAAVQTVEFLETGTQLVFRPFVGADDHIRLEIHPKDSTGGLTASNLPFEQTTEVTTNVILKDGHTILIGGLFREVSTASRGQVPIIGNLPIAGALFRNSRDSTQREEVIMLLTIHVVKDEEENNKQGIALLNDVERYRVGMREGMQWFGRERLAQAHYRWAMEHLSKGHTGAALWDLSLAINNNPKMQAAIQLRDKLSGERWWEEDGSAIRHFVTRQIMKETGGQMVPFGRPDPWIEMPELRGPSGFDDGPENAPRTAAGKEES